MSLGFGLACTVDLGKRKMRDKVAVPSSEWTWCLPCLPETNTMCCSMCEKANIELQSHETFLGIIETVTSFTYACYFLSIAISEGRIFYSHFKLNDFWRASGLK